MVGREAGEALSLALEGPEPSPGQARRGAALEAALEKSYRVSRLEVGRGLTALQASVDRLRIDEVIEADAAVLRTALARVGLPAGPPAPRESAPFDLQAALKTIYHPDPPPPDPGSGSGGGNPTCGHACSMECNGGSSCPASCSPAGCATCTCPASCTCT